MKWGGVDLPKLKLEILKTENPVGHLRFELSNINPSTYLGFGTWELWGAGKVPVGVNSTDTDFNTVEKTGGNKNQDISHTHSINGHTHTLNNHTHTTNNSSVLTSGSTAITIEQMPSHRHTMHGRIDRYQGTGNIFREIFGYNEVSGNESNVDTYATGGSQGHTHTIPAHNHGNTGASNANTSSTSLNTNSSGGNISLLQPYITCYIFKRVS